MPDPICRTRQGTSRRSSTPVAVRCRCWSEPCFWASGDGLAVPVPARPVQCVAGAPQESPDLCHGERRQS